MTQTADPSFTIRSFCAPDAPACQKLYLEGLLGGRIAENDTGLDINDIDAAYMKAEGNHFWIAQCSDGQIVGMVGVQHHEPGMAEIRRCFETALGSIKPTDALIVGMYQEFGDQVGDNAALVREIASRPR